MCLNFIVCDLQEVSFVSHFKVDFSIFYKDRVSLFPFAYEANIKTMKSLNPQFVNNQFNKDNPKSQKSDAQYNTW